MVARRRSVALPFAADGAEGDITKIDVAGGVSTREA
jgi:hypothetical protein